MLGGAPGWHRDFAATAGFVAVPAQLTLAHSSAFETQRRGMESARGGDAEAQQNSWQISSGVEGGAARTSQKKRRRR